ncbi:uncharacterized protein LOC135498684 [Lineus longissimus]|uniref:uncharacterized protein LOC135498684 n=1 Tax=Lineus longissimus TaxID=88925 RepID=UPI00315D43E8
MSSPRTLEDAIKRIRQLETAKLLLQQGARSASSGTSTNIKVKVASATPASNGTGSTPKTDSDLSQVLDILKKTDTRIKDLETSSASGSSRNAGRGRGDGSCWNCKEFGHRARECPSIKCYTCGELGHTSPSCPQMPENSQSGSSRGGQTPSRRQ